MENTYIVTVIIKSIGFEKSYTITAPTEGKARTRAMLEYDGPTLAGEFVEYEVRTV